MKREVKQSKAAASDATDEHHSERNSSYPGTSPLLTSVINELRKGVRHATLRASAAAYRVVLFLTRSIRSYPPSPYKVGILRWTDWEPVKSQREFTEYGDVLFVLCSPQDKHLEAFPLPPSSSWLPTSCNFWVATVHVKGVPRAYQRGARVRQHRAQPLALWLWTGPQWKEAYLEKACLWHPVDNRPLLQIILPSMNPWSYFDQSFSHYAVEIFFCRISTMRFRWNFFFFFSCTM